jgi:SAM-dependent methyltransferase
MPESTPLSAETKAARASSFGGAASLYERYRPGPPLEAVEWVLPERVGTVVDLGAGTGALTRLLVGRVDQVVAVEPDDRMRAVLAEAVPGARAVAGRGEAIPLPDGSVDAVLASSSWHWMETVPTLREIARVLVPGGVVSAMWSGPDPDSGLVAQAQALLGAGAGAGGDGDGDGDGDASASASASGSAATAMGIDEESQAELSAAMSDQNNLIQSLEIPPGLPFDRPEKKVITWNVALNADELIGLLGTFSWVILMDDTARERLFETARRVLKDALGVSGDATVDVGYRAEVFKARRHD